MTSIIEVQALEKSFDRKRVIKNISFSIKSKEIFGLLGPSGAGKTTIINILTGQLLFERGSVHVFANPVGNFKRPDHRKNIGVLSDLSGLYIRLSIEENLRFYCHLYGLPHSTIKEVLDFVGLYEERKKKVNKLSKGMIQRILLARAILHRPKLLFLDEPTSSLDPSNSAYIHRGLLRLNEEGTTILLTTHDMLEADLLCDRIAFLHEGMIKEIGTPQALKEKYSDRTVTIERKNGEKDIFPLQLDYADHLSALMKKEDIKRIYTNEPNLGEIFMKVTGSELT